MVNGVNIINVNTENVSEHGIFCIKNKKADGYARKLEWFRKNLNSGLKIHILSDQDDKQLGFIEYIRSEMAWRPVNALNQYFIHCIALFTKDARNKSLGSMLLEICESEAKKEGKTGVCVMVSNGPWMADKRLFENNGYEIVDQKNRFQLMYKSLNNKSIKPEFNDWEAEQKKFKGWHLVYSDQCPWHENSAVALCETALDYNIDLKLKKISTPKQAQKAPSGFGTFTLLKNGEVLADHYISKTRFKNILKKLLK